MKITDGFKHNKRSRTRTPLHKIRFRIRRKMRKRGKGNVPRSPLAMKLPG